MGFLLDPKVVSRCGSWVPHLKPLPMELCRPQPFPSTLPLASLTLDLCPCLMVFLSTAILPPSEGTLLATWMMHPHPGPSFP